MIVVGTNRLSVDTLRHQVQIVIYHSSFDAKLLRNDIGLIKLAEPIKFNELVSAIDLATLDTESKYLTPTTDDLTITGWGAEVERGPQVVDLRYAMETFDGREG